MIESGWILKFKDGYRCALSEEKYKLWSEKNSKDELEVEEHWFNLKDGCSRNCIHKIMTNV